MAETTVIEKPVKKKTVQASINVKIELLDSLMTLAGELVLSRNQLLRGISTGDLKSAALSSQRLDLITSELQEAIMTTRMQPIDNILSDTKPYLQKKYGDLDTSIDLTIEGGEVEFDRSILKTIETPLLTIVDFISHEAVKSIDDRALNPKAPPAHISIQIFHDSGQVRIVIQDDKSRPDPAQIADRAVKQGLVTQEQLKAMSDREKLKLIFLPGYFTNQCPDHAGWALDTAVKSFESLGGTLDIKADRVQGTCVQIKLPLTLSIIPSQIIRTGKERFALPQVNLDELLRIPADRIKEEVEKVGDAAVVRLRGELLPIVELAAILGIEKFYRDPENTMFKTDRRKQIGDRRSVHYPLPDDAGYPAQTPPQKTCQSHWKKRGDHDRRHLSRNAMNIAVVSSGNFKYGLIVDEFFDTEEIVIKPMGRHIKKCPAYSGATIMGDGNVALILDITRIARVADLSRVSSGTAALQTYDGAAHEDGRTQELITFKNHESEHCAALLNDVDRIEKIKSSDIEYIGHQCVARCRGRALPLFEISQAADVKPLADSDIREVIVFKSAGKELGLIVMPPVNTRKLLIDVDENTLKGPAVKGSINMDGHTTLFLDTDKMLRIFKPEWF